MSRREILFRGKRIDDGEWVEGDLLQYAGTTQIWVQTDDGKWNCIVDPETICQYTGLTDKNGRKIFEGDILCNHYDDLYPENKTMSVIVWDNFRWGIKNRGVIDEFDDFDCENGEVAGNIFDNPELIS